MSFFGPDPAEFSRFRATREDAFNRMLRQMALSTVVRSQTPNLDPYTSYLASGPLLASQQQGQPQQPLTPTVQAQPIRDYEELLGSADTYGIESPDRYDPAVLEQMIDARRRGDVEFELDDAALRAINLQELTHQLGRSGAGAGFMAPSAWVGMADSLLETAQRIPFLGDAVSRIESVQDADRWLAKIEEGLRWKFGDTPIGMSKGMAGAVAYAAPATASWKLMGAVGAIPRVATVGSRISPLGRATVRGLASEWMIEGGGDAPISERAINIGLGAAFGAGSELRGVLGQTAAGAGIGALAGAIASENDPQAMALGAALGAAGFVGFGQFLNRAQQSFPTRSFPGFTPPDQRLLPEPEIIDAEWSWADDPAGGGGGFRGEPRGTDLLNPGGSQLLPQPQRQLPAGPQSMRVYRGQPSNLPMGPHENPWTGRFFSPDMHTAEEFAGMVGGPADIRYLDLTPEQVELSRRTSQEAGFAWEGENELIVPPELAAESQLLRRMGVSQAATEASQLTKQTTIIESPVLADLSQNARYDDADVAWATVESYPGQVGVVQNVGDVGTTIQRILRDQMPNGVGPQDFRVVERPVESIISAAARWNDEIISNLDTRLHSYLGGELVRQGRSDELGAFWREAEMGFLSSEGRFLDRKEAARVASVHKQARIASDELHMGEFKPGIVMRNDILVSSGRPITNQMVKDYQDYGMFQGQRVNHPDSAAELRVVKIGPEETLVEGPGGGGEMWVATSDLLPSKSSAISDIPGAYEQFKTFAQVQLDMQSIQAGIKPLDLYSNEAAEILPELIDQFTNVMGAQKYYAAALRHVIEEEHIKAIRQLAPEADQAILRDAQAVYREVAATHRLPASTLEDAAAARGMTVEPVPGKGFVLVDQMSNGELRVPVDSEPAAREFLNGFQRELIDDAPVSTFPIEVIPTPVGYSETRGRVFGEWIDTQHEVDAAEGLVGTFDEMMEGGGGFLPPPPPPGQPWGSFDDDMRRLPPWSAETHGRQWERLRRDDERRYNQILEKLGSIVSDIGRPIRNLAIMLDEQAHRAGVTAGRYYEFVSNLSNAYTRTMNQSSVWKDQAFTAVRPVRNRFLRDGTFWEAANADSDVIRESIMKNAGFNPAERQAVLDWDKVMSDFFDTQAAPRFPDMVKVRNYVSWMRKFEDQLPWQMRHRPDGSPWDPAQERFQGDVEMEKDISKIIPRYFDGFFKFVEMDQPYRELKAHLRAEGVPDPVRDTFSQWADARMWGLDPSHDLAAKGMRFVLDSIGRPFGLRFTMEDIMKISHWGFAASYRAALGGQVAPLVRDLPQVLIGGMQVGMDKLLPVIWRYARDADYRDQIVARAIEHGAVQRQHAMSIDADVFGGGGIAQQKRVYGDRAGATREWLAEMNDAFQDNVAAPMGVRGGIQGTKLDFLAPYGRLGDWARTMLHETGYESVYNALQTYVPQTQNLSGPALEAAKKQFLKDARIDRYQGSIQRMVLRMVDAGDYEGAARAFGNEVANSQNRYGMAEHPQAFRRMGPVTGRIAMKFGTFNSQTLANTAQILADPSISPEAKAGYAAQVGALQAIFAGATMITGWNFMKASLAGIVSLPGSNIFSLMNDLERVQSMLQSATGQELSPDERGAQGAMNATGIPFVPGMRDFNPWHGGVRSVQGVAEAAQWGPEAVGRFLTTGEAGDPWLTRLNRHGIPQPPPSPLFDATHPWQRGQFPPMEQGFSQPGSGAMF